VGEEDRRGGEWVFEGLERVAGLMLMLLEC